MKKAIILALAAFSAAVSSAQFNSHNFPAPSGDFVYTPKDGGEPIKYHYVHEGAVIQLYDSRNVLNDVPCMRNGQRFFGNALHFFERHDEDYLDRVSDVIYDFIPDNLKSAVKGEYLNISIKGDPATGKIKEMIFDLSAFEPNSYAQLPIEFFGEVEQWLRKNENVTPTALARELNYLKLDWFGKPVE